MKKVLLTLFTLLMLLVFTAAACAEAVPVADVQRSLPPVNMPPVPEDMHAQWPLYAEEPALPVNITLTQGEESYIVTLHDADEWGVPVEGGSVWQYDAEGESWYINEIAQAAQPGAVELHVPAAVYAENGLPVWSCDSIDETYTLWVEDYSADPAAPEFFLSLTNEDGAITLPIEDIGFTTYSYGDNIMSYCVYNAQHRLTLGTYMQQKENGDFVSYAVTPNETENDGTYVLYYINVQTAAGDNVLWTEGAWQDIEGNEVAAPEGYSAEELPFEVILP